MFMANEITLKTKPLSFSVNYFFSSFALVCSKVALEIILNEKNDE